MPHLSIRLLGSFEANLNEMPVSRFHSDKVRALLAYLCVEGQGDHRREKLAGLLWPDFPERTARANLRNALANLRQILGDRQLPGNSMPPYPFLKVTRQTIHFNLSSDCQIDARDFLAVVEERSPSLEELAGAVKLIRGEFMEGFSLPGSDIFEEWLLLQRERFNRLTLETLHRLASGLSNLGQFKRALEYAWRQVELDPLQENAQRQLMSLLAFNGQVSQALTQYENYRNLLARELTAEPSEETIELERLIRRDLWLPLSCLKLIRQLFSLKSKSWLRIKFSWHGRLNWLDWTSFLPKPWPGMDGLFLLSANRAAANRPWPRNSSGGHRT